MSTADIILIDTLHLSTTIGPDCWLKPRPQPITLSTYLHLAPGFLARAAHSDDVRHSVHYGHLTKEITALLSGSEQGQGGGGFESADAVVEAVAERAVRLAGEEGGGLLEVRVVLGLPKMILLAGGFEVDVTFAPGEGGRVVAVNKKVYVRDLVLPIIIGVNPPEREAKQRVVINLVFDEDPSSSSVRVDYPQIVKQLAEEISQTAYLTLEKLVTHLARSAALAPTSDPIRSITARAQKPSAIAFAHSSGVEITRSRESFLGVQVK